MTVPISPGSARAAVARRFGAELDRAMRTRKVGRRTLAKATGNGESTIVHWRSGQGMPRLENAERLAESLGWERLAIIARSSRVGECATCGKAFVNEGGGPKLYCSPQCRKVKAKMRLGTPVRERAVVAERRLQDHRAAVEAMCMSCEPEGMCHQDDCPLRTVSPLPLMVDHRREVRVARPAPGPYGTPENAARTRAAGAAATAERWARPGERERQTAAMVARHAERPEILLRVDGEPGFCEDCGKGLPTLGSKAHRRRFCDETCRNRSYRARRAS